jgi:hypothetical protein
MKTNLTKEQGAILAQMVRQTPEESEPAIIWAVKHHLSLFLYGFEKPERLVEALLLACNTLRDDTFVNLLGLEALEKISGKRLFPETYHSTCLQFIKDETDIIGD